MTRIDIKPLSTNEAWKGKRYKTDKYKMYERACKILIPKLQVPESHKLQIEFVFGFSSKNSDWDNPIKMIQDILQKKFGFNDNRVYKGIVEKVDVKKGEEFIEFEITELKSDRQ